MLSSFEFTPDELMRVALCVATAINMLRPSPFMPVCIMNEFDDFFGYSVNIVFKYQRKDVY